MQSCDVLIVGGGPSGSSCGWKLRQAGVNVLILDRKTFPRDKPCAGWITPPVVERLELDVQDYARGRTWQPLTGFRCGLIYGPSTDIAYTLPVSFGIRRIEFDHYLLDRCGTASYFHEAVQEITRRDRHWIINGRYQTRMLVGAGGTHCPVARWQRERVAESPSGETRENATRENGEPITVVAQEAEYKIPAGVTVNVAPSVPQLYFCRDLLGYGWIFRKGDYLNVGLGRAEAAEFSQHLERFKEFVSQLGVPLPDQRRAWRGHSYRLHAGGNPPPAADGLLLLGDSAGLSYALSGEGILPAVESGLLAAEILQAPHQDFSLAALQPYQLQLLRRFGNPQRSHWMRLLPWSWLAVAVRGLFANRLFARHVVMDRWFLRRFG